MGALPVILDDLGLDPYQVGKATTPTSGNHIEGEDHDLSDISTTGPNTPELHLLSPSPIANATSSTWALDSSV